MSRQDVLALLREQEGAFVSGEEISHRLGLSRAAIWKAVDALRREGYTVEARTGRGYRLLDAPDVLTEPEIRRFLGETARVGRTLVCLAEVDSTNLRARQLAAEGAADGTVVVADRQTAGRGRLGRSFQSPGGQGIYLTALLRPESAAGAAVAGDGHGWSSGVSGRRAAVRRQPRPEMAQRSGAGWEKALRHFDRALPGGGDRPACRSWCWASESMSPSGRRISRPEVREIATSLRPGPGPRCVQARPGGGRSSGRWTASAQPWRQESLVRIWPSYRRRCVNLGRTVRLLRPDGGGETAEALDIDEEFGLVVRRPDGAVKTVRSGEVSVRGLYGYTE